MIYDTIDYNGKTITIHYDTDAENPRDFECNLGTIYSHDRMAEGDLDEITTEHGTINPARLTKDYIWLWIWKYEHGGVAFSASAEGQGNPFTGRAAHAYFDSGRWGIIAVSKDKARDAYGVQRITPALRARILAGLKAEVEEFSAYCNGDVFGYTIEDEDGQELDGQCFGFYGDDFDANGLLDAARAEVDALDYVGDTLDSLTEHTAHAA